jgi:hypothetical protein
MAQTPFAPYYREIRSFRDCETISEMETAVPHPLSRISLLGLTGKTIPETGNF